MIIAKISKSMSQQKLNLKLKFTIKIDSLIKIFFKAEVIVYLHGGVQYEQLSDAGLWWFWSPEPNGGGKWFDRSLVLFINCKNIYRWRYQWLIWCQNPVWIYQIFQVSNNGTTRKTPQLISIHPVQSSPAQSTFISTQPAISPKPAHTTHL